MSKISIEVTLNQLKSTEKVWKYWNDPKHIVHWYFASDDWHVASAENNLEIDGKLLIKMAAKDGSFGFDYFGHYAKIEPFKEIVLRLGDNRLVETTFYKEEKGIRIVEVFEIEDQHTIEQEKNGWQAILNNFKAYAESMQAYINDWDGEAQLRLITLRETVHTLVPEATEKMTYQMPTFYLKGNLLHFAAFKKHIGFYPGPACIEHFQEALKGYKTSKGAIQFQLSEALPLPLITEMIQYRVKHL